MAVARDLSGRESRQEARTEKAKVRWLASIPCLSPLLLLFSQFFYAGFATTFTCNAAAATCRVLVGYVVPNATTYGHIQSLFQVDALSSLLGANNLELSTPGTQTVKAYSTVLVPFPCRCVNGTSTSDGIPVYKVTASDSGLDAIARYTFDLFVSYQEIAKANNISNPDVITVGEELYIPLPCSCDPVNGQEVAHLEHVVALESSVDEIAAEFGVDNTTLLRLNGISDPTKLQAGQILDVPLRGKFLYRLRRSMGPQLRSEHSAKPSPNFKPSPSSVSSEKQLSDKVIEYCEKHTAATTALG